MKLTNKLCGLVITSMLFLATVAHASLGFDTYKATRTYVLTAPQNISFNATPLVTNGPIDLVKFIGVGKIDLETITNTGGTGGTLTATLYGSNDRTNLVALSNFYLINSATPDAITNAYYGTTNLVATNSVLLPGIVVNPNAASAGYSTPYLSYYGATNSSAITLNGASTVQVGLNLDDQFRYLYVVYTPGGTVTNFTTSALLTAGQFAQ